MWALALCVSDVDDVCAGLQAFPFVMGALVVVAGAASLGIKIQIL